MDNNYLPRPLYNFSAVLKSYQGEMPLSQFLKAYAQQHKLGSGDRKALQRLVYSYFRLGKAMPEQNEFVRLACAMFLLEDASDRLNEQIISTYTSLAISDLGLSQEEKLAIVQKEYPSFIISGIFAFSNLVSANIDNVSHKFLQQPYTWIRIRKKHLQAVSNELKLSGIEFFPATNHNSAVAVKNSTKLQELETFEKGYFEIQDLSSQQCADFIPLNNGESWWDCCAASGGKSLMMLDKEPKIKLTVSDIRQSILQNLIVRFKKANAPLPNLFVADLVNSNEWKSNISSAFDGVLVDAPCSGSGTWARTPEAMAFFKEDELKKYNTLQFEIMNKVLPFVKNGGHLVYITCSIFAKENEDMVQKMLKENTKLQLQNQSYLVNSLADSLFIATFLKK